MEILRQVVGFLFLGISLRNLQLLLYSNPKVERAVNCSKNSSFLSLIHPVETEMRRLLLGMINDRKSKSSEPWSLGAAIRVIKFKVTVENRC